MNRPLWKEKSLVEQDVRTQRGLSFVFLLVTFLGIWRKWQKTHAFVLYWWCGLSNSVVGCLLHGEAIAARCRCVYLVLWSACGSQRWFTPALVLERKLFRDVMADWKKKVLSVPFLESSRYSVKASLSAKEKMWLEGYVSELQVG